MTGKPWSNSATVFKVRGAEFRALPEPDGTITLQRWTPGLRSWTRLGVFPSRADARAYAREVADS